MDIHQLTCIFCQVDDFCKEFHSQKMNYLLPSSKSRKGPLCCLSDSEIMTILILFQSSQWRNFKDYYKYFLPTFHKTAFPKLPSYNRFIEIMHRVIFHLVLFSQIYSGKRTGIYYIDSTCLPVCHLKRSTRHKTFDQIAQYGRTSVGWFFDLKLHIVINDRGELIAFKITNGKRNDAKAGESIMQKLQGFMLGDKGYLGKALFARLLEKGLKLITRGRKMILQPFFRQIEEKRPVADTTVFQNLPATNIPKLNVYVGDYKKPLHIQKYSAWLVRGFDNFQNKYALF